MTATDGGLRRMFRQAIPSAQWTTIETGAVAQGVPDAEFCFPGGVQGWIEFKVTGGWAVTLRPEQVGWLSRRVRLGGRVFVAVRRQVTEPGPRKVIADELHLYKIRDTYEPAQLRDLGLKVSAGNRHADYIGNDGPGNWDWNGITNVLKGLVS